MFEQIKLPYGTDGLEPHLDALTVETHYGKHHAAYTKNFNELVGKVPALAGKSAEYILSHLDEVPKELRIGMRNNGGGYLNHNLYFGSLSPDGGGEPAGALGEEIRDAFGSFQRLRESMSQAAAGQFGSGYAWLVLMPEGKLEIMTTANQDTPVNNGILGTLLCLDVWEHAYYLKYKNLRVDYIESFWKLVDWKVVAQRYEKARG